MRLVIFPWVAWYATVQDADTGYSFILMFFGYGLFCLVFMHAYWFGLFVKILMYFISKGKAEDLIEENMPDQDEFK